MLKPDALQNIKLSVLSSGDDKVETKLTLTLALTLTLTLTPTPEPDAKGA